MKLTKLVLFSVLATAFCQGGLQAQTLQRDQGPREFPPSSYMGKQYVDSAGCVYIRAGIDGSVTWVPRVSRDRKVVCGYQPSLSQAEASASPPPRVEPEQITLAPATPTRVVRSAPTARVALATPAPRAVAVPRAQVATAPVQRSNRVVPKHVYLNRQNTRNVSVPEGYRSVWEDDRLNPYRAEQTLAGNAQARQIWTATVPQKLVRPGKGDPLKGRVATVYAYPQSNTPGVIYSSRSAGPAAPVRNAGGKR